MKGKAYLVGAGPGDYGLITIKGMELIKKADVIIYDRLINSEYLLSARQGCELIYAGKNPQNHEMTQEDISHLIADKALEGKLVVRLKGGDPYVFGRGGEEALQLRESGVEFEVVPGISSAVGGLAYAGIPITHRGLADSFHVITGHLAAGERDDWGALAELKGTLVFLMGMENLGHISRKLIENGKSPDTPVAVINWATTGKQKVAVASLAGIEQEASKAGLKSPSLIAIGDVVALRDELAFFERLPLFGKRVIVTRARHQASSLSKRLRELGAEAVEIPSIEIVTETHGGVLDRAIENIKSYTHIVFTSVNGVDIFFEGLYSAGLDSRSLCGMTVAAIGPATEAALKGRGIRADIVPSEYIGESVAASLLPTITRDSRVLLPRAKGARRELLELLSRECHVDEVITYEAAMPKEIQDSERAVAELEKADYVTFTSSSTVRNFINLAGDEGKRLLEGKRLVSIGPITSLELEKYGLRPQLQAAEYTIDGMIEAMMKNAEV